MRQLNFVVEMFTRDVGLCLGTYMKSQLTMVAAGRWRKETPRAAQISAKGQR